MPSEYDYRFNTEQKDEIIAVLKVLYLLKKQENLPVFGIFKMKLDEFTTTEKDMLRGKSRFPDLSLRMWGSDLVPSP